MYKLFVAENIRGLDALGVFNDTTPYPKKAPVNISPTLRSQVLYLIYYSSEDPLGYWSKTIAIELGVIRW